MAFDLVFQGQWRDYQARVLAELDAHLADARLNVVAAPGSGKTVLGLEVMRRIGRPALILAPSIAIRNQWVDRLCGLFLPPGTKRPDWISTSLARPALLTVGTYQALCAAAEMDEDEDEAEAEADDACEAADRVPALAAFYNARGPATLILDEAHHLRNAWWKALTQLSESLAEPRIVSLTATPPYDVDRAEWRNYESLCGPADAEISIPELVRNGDLCPHQDYVHVSRPTASEAGLISAHRDGLIAFIVALRQDAGFLALVAGHPWLADPVAHEAEILDHPEQLSAMLVFARAGGVAPPPAALDLLGLAGTDLPDLELGWIEILLDGLGYGAAGEALQADAAAGARLKTMRAALSKLGAVEGKRVRLFEDRDFYPLLAGSLAKLGSIAAIADAEVAALGPGLRMVILSDYVRADDLAARGDEPFRPAKLGAATIFETLRRRGMTGARLGVLTGTLVVLPEAALPALHAAAAQAGLPADGLAARPLEQDAGFVRIESKGAAADRIVALVTTLFDAGEVNLLVGTQALLGEGWDAPALNSLILASNVGSYMLSNQMRGRAIRTDRRDPAKTANIWHLATVSPDTLPARLGLPAPRADPFDPIGRALGPDMALLKRRFQAFEGVWNADAARIENGMARLALDGGGWDEAGIDALNAATLALAADRPALARRWTSALAGGGAHPAMRQVARLSYAPRWIGTADTLRYLAISGLIGAPLAAFLALHGLHLPSGGWHLVWPFAGLTLFYALPRLLKALWLLVRNGTLEGSLGSVGTVILDMMAEAGVLTHARGDLSIATERGPLGEALVRLDGASRNEERLFLDALGELLGPVTNPRYLLVRSSRLLGRRRTDYHAVPAIFGRNWHLAERFAKVWSQRVGRARLVFLRDAEGRRLLLQARARSFAAGFRRDVGRLSLWG